MKALKKVLLGIATVAMVGAACSFAACSGDETTYTGEYTYVSYGSTYGVKVNVTVDEDDKITDVSIAESDYVTVTSIWENRAIWDDGVDALLAKYEGKSAVDVMAQYVDVQDDGTPTTTTGDSFNTYDSDLLLTGATQGSGRLLLAVQNALESAGYKSYVGEYTYESYGSTYGIKVNVVVKDSKIEKVAIVDSDYVSVTSIWENRAVWDDGIATLLTKYEGKTVSEIKALTVAVGDDGTPAIQSSEDFVSYDSDLLLTGATQGSGRLVLAVQNALKNAQ